jgi:hypothetical protein
VLGGVLIVENSIIFLQENRLELCRLDHARYRVKARTSNTIPLNVQQFHDCIPNQSLGNETNTFISKVTVCQVQVLQRSIGSQC